MDWYRVMSDRRKCEKCNIEIQKGSEDPNKCAFGLPPLAAFLAAGEVSPNLGQCCNCAKEEGWEQHDMVCQQCKTRAQQKLKVQNQAPQDPAALELFGGIDLAAALEPFGGIRIGPGVSHAEP